MGILVVIWVCWLFFKFLIFKGVGRTLNKAVKFAESLGVQRVFSIGMIENPDVLKGIRTKLASRNNDFAMLDGYKQYGFIIRAIDDFMTKLAIFKSKYKPVVDILDPQGSEVISDRALNNYLENMHAIDEHNASDFYLDAFTGSVFELYNSRHISHELAEKLLFQTNAFLQAEPEYITTTTKSLTDTWGEILKERKRMGIDT